MIPGIRQARVLDLVGAIYAAASDPRLWSGLLERMADTFHGTVGSVIFEDFSRQRASVAVAVRVDPVEARRYEEYYAARNAWMIAWGPRYVTGNIVTSQMVLPDAEFRKTEYYADFLRPIGLRHHLGVCLLREAQALSHLSLLRGPGRGPFGEDDVALLRILTPHLQRALRLHQKLSDLRQESGAAMDALDRLPYGVVLLDAAGRPLRINRMARGIFAARDGLRLGREGLEAAAASETSALRRLLAGAIRTGAGDGLVSGGTVAVSRPSQRRPYVVTVSPFGSVPFSFSELRPIAAVFIADPERAVEADEALLSRLHGLTPAEAEMASRLLQGQSVGQTAEELRITGNTARTHLKHIFEKTETRSQSQLVRLLLLDSAGRRSSA